MTALSKHEQKILAELELQLLGVGTPAVTPSDIAAPEQESARRWSRRHVMTGALAALIGTALLAVGANLPSIPVGAAGFVLMAGGVYLSLLPTGEPRREKAKNPAGAQVIDDTPGAGTMADTAQSSFRGGHCAMALWSLAFWL